MGIENTKKILILGLEKAFSMRDDETGEIVPGRKMFYAEPRDDKGAVGYAVADKCFMRQDMSILNAVTVPGLYEAKINWIQRGLRSYGRFVALRLLKEIKLEF